MVIQSVVDTGRNTIRDVHKLTINSALNLGIVDDTATLEVGDIEAVFRTDTQKERWRAKSLMGEGEIFELLEDELQPDDHFWDVGAAVGTYSVFAAHLVDRVVSFEPEPLNMDRLEENCELNGLKNVQPMPVALSDEPGSADLDRKTGMGNGEHKIASDGDIEVDLVRGDQIGRYPDVVKIDVEGHELKVLEGLSDHLANVRMLIIEVHEGVKAEDVIERLDVADFSTEAIGDRDSVLGGESDEFHLLAIAE